MIITPCILSEPTFDPLTSCVFTGLNDVSFLELDCPYIEMTLFSV